MKIKKREIVENVSNAFLPITLATSFEAQEQCVEESVRWFDRESADVKYEEFAYAGTNTLALPDRVDTVIQVYTDRVVSEIFTAQTLLLGVTILDYDIMTLALKQTHLGDLRTFLASRFRWRWIKPYLYVDGMVTAVTSLVVQYLMHYDWEDATLDINGKALDWVIRYARALVKQREGRILRMGSIVQAPLDGAELMSEGKAEERELRDELRRVRSVIPVGRSF